jgi:hypothetical protein
MNYFGLKSGVYSTWRGIAAGWRVLAKGINLNLKPQTPKDFLGAPGSAAFRGSGLSEPALLAFIRDRNAAARNAIDYLKSLPSNDPQMAYRTESREHAYKFASQTMQVSPDAVKRLSDPARLNRILNLLIMSFPGVGERISTTTEAKLMAPTRDLDGTLPSISELLSDPVRGRWDDPPVGPAVLTPTSTVHMSDPAVVAIGDHIVYSILARTSLLHPLDGAAHWYLVLNKKTNELQVAVFGAGTHPMSIVDALNIPTARVLFEAMAETFKWTIEEVDIAAAKVPPTWDEINSFASKDPALACTRQLARILDAGGYLPRAVRFIFGSGSVGSPPTVPPTDGGGGGDDDNFVLDRDPAVDPRVEEVVDAAKQDAKFLDDVTLQDDGKTLAEVVGDQPLKQLVNEARTGTDPAELLENVRDDELHAEPPAEPPVTGGGDGDGQGGEPPVGDPHTKEPDPKHEHVL